MKPSASSVRLRLTLWYTSVLALIVLALQRGRGAGPYRAIVPARVSPLRFPAPGLHSRFDAPRVGSAMTGIAPTPARISRELVAAVAACILPPESPGADETASPYAGTKGHSNTHSDGT